MKKGQLADWVGQSRNNQILLSFSLPKTPTQVRKELDIKKFNLKPFLTRNLIKCLSPEIHKGRLYCLTNEARRLLDVQNVKNENNSNFDLLGWVMASPKQRYVVLNTLSKDSIKRNSEEIRKRASSLNPCLSRISTKDILNELINKELVDTEIGEDRRRYYWITDFGRSIAGGLH